MLFRSITNDAIKRPSLPLASVALTEMAGRRMASFVMASDAAICIASFRRGGCAVLTEREVAQPVRHSRKVHTKGIRRGVGSSPDLSGFLIGRTEERLLSRSSQATEAAGITDAATAALAYRYSATV